MNKYKIKYFDINSLQKEQEVIAEAYNISDAIDSVRHDCNYKILILKAELIDSLKYIRKLLESK